VHENILDKDFAVKLQLSNLCKLYNLGKPISIPRRVHGGLLHIMWHVNTDKGPYAIKQLSDKVDLSNTVVIQNYELSENIANNFIAQGIPAVCALKNDDGEYLSIIDKIGFLVYPWVEARAIPEGKISEHHASQIAAILAKMHLMRLEMPNMPEFKFDVFTSPELVELISTSAKDNCSFVKDLQKASSDLIAINDAYIDAISVLKSDVIVSHGDLDPKNVLWNNSGNPVLIDWESARKLNPTYEIINASLDWSGITKEFNKRLFSEMLVAYKQAGGIVEPSSIEAAFYGALGNWINWMVYNIERSCKAKDLEQKTIGAEQVVLVLPTILHLKCLMPELIRVCKL